MERGDGFVVNFEVTNLPTNQRVLKGFVYSFFGNVGSLHVEIKSSSDVGSIGTAESKTSASESKDR